ncbi:MAG: type II CAAX endopeptidase family protein [Erysipelotrichaceae bacterium]|nr:type II CAAX endopeptidase family protein [Erysipelotrichaceae bacterium]
MSDRLNKFQVIFILIVYFGGYLLLGQEVIPAFFLKGLDVNHILIYLDVLQIVILAIVIAVCYGWYGRQYKRINKHPVRNFGIILFSLLLLYTSMILIEMYIISPLGLSEAENQVNNDLMFHYDPLGETFGAVIFAPIAEETVFRGCIFQPLRKKHGFLFSACIAGFLFGFLHIIASITDGNFQNMLYIIEYGILGFILAIPFELTDSLYGSISLHALYNGITVLIMLLTTGR